MTEAAKIGVALGLLLSLSLPAGATTVAVATTDSLSHDPVADAEVRAAPVGSGAPRVTAYTDSLGRVRLRLDAGHWSVRIRHGSFAVAERRLRVGDTDTTLAVRLQPILYRMPERLATAVAAPSAPGVTVVSAAEVHRYPAPTADPVRVLRVLPGVASGGDQAASAYSVRGGSWDENLVYIEGVEVEAPQLLRTGLAETLSPVNGELLEHAEFHTGVLPARLGDRLSSALEVDYRQPDSLEVAAVVGGTRTAATVSARTGRARWLLGARRADLSRLTKDLQTEGDFQPEYRDLQGVASWDGDAVDGRVYGARARSRFALVPESRALRYDCHALPPAQPPRGPCDQFVGTAAGHERFESDLDVLGARLRWQARRLSVTAAASLAIREEREDTDQAYAADWVPNAASPRVIESDWFLSHETVAGRLRQERVEATIGVTPVVSPSWELGFGARRTDIDGERVGIDSLWLDAVVLPPEAVDEGVDRAPRDLFAYGRRTWQPGAWTADLEARAVHFGGPDEDLLLPRLRLGRQAGAWRLTSAAGVAAQPPLFRELLGAEVVPRSQKSADLTFEAVRQAPRARWRGTLFLRRGWDRMSFTVEDVALRYSGRNDSRTQAMGADVLVRGQVGRAAGTLSYSWLWARENLQGDGRGWLVMATDPRHTESDYAKTVILRRDVPCGPCHLRECPTDHRCMEEITPEMVMDASERLLAREDS